MALPNPPTDSIEALEAYTLLYLQNGTQAEQGRLLMTLLFRANRNLALQVLRAEFPELVGAALPLLTNASTIMRFEADGEDANQFVYDDEAGQNAMVQRFLQSRQGWENSPNVVLGGNFIWRKLDGSGTVNTAPAASNVAIGGGDTAKVGVPLTGTSTYSDADNDAKAETIHRWYRADNASGLNRTVIAGAQSASFTPTAVEQGKVIQYGAAYTAATGTVTGAETLSSYSAVVAAASGGAAPTISSNFAQDWTSDQMVRPFTTGRPDAFGGLTATAIAPNTALSGSHLISYDIENIEDGVTYLITMLVGGDFNYLDITCTSLQEGYPQAGKEFFHLSTLEKIIGNPGSDITRSEGGYYLVKFQLTGRGHTTRLVVTPRPTFDYEYAGDGVKAFLISTTTIDAL